MGDLIAFVSGHYSIIAVFMIMVITGLMTLLERRIYNQLMPTLQETKRLWDDSLLEALHRPLTALIWTLGVSFALLVITSRVEPAIFGAATQRLRDIAIVGLLCGERLVG